MRKIVIAGASGNVGSQVAQKLMREDGLRLTLLSSKGTVPFETKNNEKIVKADLTDVAEIERITEGADVLFWMVPANIFCPSIKEWYDKVVASGLNAVEKNEIPKVILISALGAGIPSGKSTVAYVADMEKAFNKVAKNVLALRPGYFMENFLMQKESIINQGQFYFPYSEDHDIPFVSATDIGNAAAYYINDENWSGQWVKNLMGPENLTLVRMAEILTELVGKKVSYIKTDYQQIRNQFAEMGCTETVQQEMVELFETLGDTDGAYATPRTLEAITPTTFTEFVQTKFLN